MDPLTTEEVTALEVYERDLYPLRWRTTLERRLYHTIRDRERERDEMIGAVQRALTAGEGILAERDELQRRCLQLESEAAEVCPEDQSLKETFKALQKERYGLMQARDWAQAEKHSAQAETERHFNEICTLKLERDELQRKLSELQGK